MNTEAEISAAAGAHEPSGAPIMHKQLSQLVVARLREAILSGAYAPGERLVEGRLAEELEVSRVPVREALRALASEGLVEVRPRHGAVVASLKPSDAREMIQIRATLEGLNARLAAEHRTPELIQKIEEVLTEGKAKADAGETAGLLELNARFHDLLYAAGANMILGDLMRSLRDRTRVLFIKPSDEEVRLTWDEHAAILRAVQFGDATLSALLAERHVMRAAQHYLDRNAR
jgi:DNA-binding GntR family transcriptional regulator